MLKYIHYVVIFTASLFICNWSFAQHSLHYSFDAGSNNISNGIYFQSNAFGVYNINKIKLTSGFRLYHKSNFDVVFGGLNVNGSTSISVKNKKFQLEGFYQWTRFSSLLYENNFGALIGRKNKRYEFKFGTHTRVFKFGKSAQKEYNISKDNSAIIEWFNIIYYYTQYLNTIDKSWNVGLSITNIDYFNLHQETNPMLNLKGYFKPSEKIELFSELWHLNSGAFNINVNHFGYFFRIGLLWNVHQ
jgi:hypothetical protein